MEYAKRLLVADTSDEFRRHLIEALQNESDMEVVGETGDGQQLLEMVRTLQPDAVVMEMVLSGMDGIEVLEQLRELPPEHRPRILVLSSYIHGAIRPGRRQWGRPLHGQALQIQHHLRPHPAAHHF